MTKVLLIRSSLAGAASVSNALLDQLVDHWRVGADDLIVRDLAGEPVPHLVHETVGAIRGGAATDQERATLALSDRLIAEVQAADVLVIGVPMYNFGIPSTLKTWFDHVLRAGVTFRYGAAGPEGLVTNKRAVVVETRGGIYAQGPNAAADAQEPHLRTLLGFIGITDVTFVRAEGLAMGSEYAERAVAQARTALASLSPAALAA
ncbi:FMN-dependent NADH-azoreductase [Zavarzinia sp. CC-PAN008]|uniref:FMN-dependent NADH-azoreductase n=1 Tax=Zavarzinia sp. CC-PAN008 TaxID=3243332 RepID=UPI003F742230